MPQSNDSLSLLQTSLVRDGRAAVATIIETWGSAPVPVGGQMAIAVDGSFAGSVSGGCVEGEVITEAMELYQRAERLRPAGDDDAILRWNSCVRLLESTPQMVPREDDPVVPTFGE